MTFLSRLASVLWRLPARSVPDVRVERDLQTPMADGTILLADRYYSASQVAQPTLLVRSPYGRRGVWGFQYGQLYAERGFQVVVQSTRGGYGSDGEFEPMVHEVDDGRVTVAWLREQRWFTGRFAMVGASYLGFAQWAVGVDPPPELGALVVQIGLDRVGPAVWAPGGALVWRSWLEWAAKVTGREEPSSVLLSAAAMFLSSSRRRFSAAYAGLPVSRSSEEVLGRPVPWFRSWLEHPQVDEGFWHAYDVSAAVGRLEVPVSLFTGWHDQFLSDTLRHYEVLRRRGQQVHLTVGPWTHAGVADHWPVMFREGLTWLRGHLLEERSSLPASPVRVLVQGLDEWQEWSDWPPPTEGQKWHLQADGGLATAPAPASAPDQFVYDPADPTPAVGGATMSDGAGVKNNRALEERPDVLTYTSALLSSPVTVAGVVTAQLHVEISGPGDFFVRLCDVDSRGRSFNVCDGILRLTPDQSDADKVQSVDVSLGATVYCFRPGHRLRIQVSGGAHPRFARNLGTDEPVADGTTMTRSTRRVHHSPDGPTYVLLPILPPQ